MFNLDYFLVTDILSYHSMSHLENNNKAKRSVQRSTLTGGIDKQSMVHGL